MIDRQHEYTTDVSAKQTSHSTSTAAADRKLQEDVQRAINGIGRLALSRAVQVRAFDGHVELSGLVPTYYMKQTAQVAAMRVDGVHQLRNGLCVGRSGTPETIDRSQNERR